MRLRNEVQTLQILNKVRKIIGIARVTDTTWLDNIGIPVSACIRHSGDDQILSVHAGKGLTHEQATIGACMEAMEYFFAEPGVSSAHWFYSTPKELVDSFGGDVHFLDFPFKVGVEVHDETAIAVVRGEELLNPASNRTPLLPAAMVFVPGPKSIVIQPHLSSSVGLGAGNNVAEATLQSIQEVMENHITSLNAYRDDSVLIDLSSCPSSIRNIVSKIKAAGLDVYLRYTKNEFDLPYFEAFIVDDNSQSPSRIVSGTGMSLNTEAAAMSALLEAVQGRLSHIHGGRDDIIIHVQKIEAIPSNQRDDAFKHETLRIKDNHNILNFKNLGTDVALTTTTECIDALLYKLKLAGMNSVVRVVHTPSDFEFSVVRIVIPKCELYGVDSLYIGNTLINTFYHDKSK